MATRTYSETIGGRKGYSALRSHALCDGCGKEHEHHHQGRVTAPLPPTWTATTEESESGGSVTLRFWCEQCSKGESQ